PAQPVLLDAPQGPRVAHRAAVADARARALRRVHADRAFGDARDARRGLHPHRAGEGPAAVADRPPARPPQRDAADRDADRALARLHRGGRDPDRDGVLLAGHRPGGVRGGAAARLPDAAGRLPPADDLGRVLQPRRRPPLLQARPADHRMSEVAVEAAAARGGVMWSTIRRQPSATIGATVLVVIAVAAILAPWIAPYGVHTQVGPVFGQPSWSH